MNIAYICRGRGFGHAAHALPIIEELSARLPAGSVEVASADSGYRYFSEHGHPCLDLGFPDYEDHSRTAIAAVLEYLRRRRGQVNFVIFDELFFGPALCQRFGLRNVFMTHIFGHELGNSKFDRFLLLTDLVVLLDFAEAHRIPDFLGSRVMHAGPVVSVPDLSRSEARTRVGLAQESFVAVATWGAANIADKHRVITHMLDRVQEAWRMITNRGDRKQPKLVLLGELPPGYQLEVDRPDVLLRPFAENATTLYRAADVVFTLGGMSMLESVRSGTRTLAFKGLTWEASVIDHLGDMDAVRVIGEQDGADVVHSWALNCRKTTGRRNVKFGDLVKLTDVLLSHVNDAQSAVHTD